MRDIEIDPLTGVKTIIDYHDDGKVTVKRVQDIEPALEFAQTIRKLRKPTKKEHWNHYAIVPVVVQLEMLKAGIDMARDPKAAIQWINKNRPELKLTDKWQDDRRAKLSNPKIIVK